MTLAPAFERGANKVAAIGLLLAVIWFVAAVLVEPLTTRLSDAQEQIGQERQLLGRLLEEARAVGARPAEAESAGAALLPGDSEAEKIAALQSRVETVAASSGVRLSSVQPIAQTSQGPLRLVGLRTIASGPIDAIQGFLHGIEDGRPTLMIQSLDMAPTARTPDADGILDLRISIMGVVASNAATAETP